MFFKKLINIAKFQQLDLLQSTFYDDQAYVQGTTFLTNTFEYLQITLVMQFTSNVNISSFLEKDSDPELSCFFQRVYWRF